MIDVDFVEQDGPMDRVYHFQERTMSSTKEHVFRTATLPLDPNRPLWRFEHIRQLWRMRVFRDQLLSSQGMQVRCVEPTRQQHGSALHRDDACSCVD